MVRSAQQADRESSSGLQERSSPVGDDRSIRGLAACPAEDEAARREFDALVAPHLPAMRARAAQLCRSHFDPDDLVQGALMRALQARDQLADLARTRPWLVTIVTNGFLDLVRRRHRRPRVVDLDVYADVETAAPDAFEPSPWDSIELDDVRTAVEQLPDDVRDTYRLFALEGRDYTEIAQLQRIPKSTVGSRLLRARKRLRELLTSRRTEVSQ
jgi:RNA polymerase sigma-70 factor, ECF subfamily